MKPTLIACAGLVAVLGCRAGTKATNPTQSNENSEKLAELNKRVDEIDGRLKKLETMLERAINGPPDPDPNTVYSVPIAGFPYVGPEYAPVTIVEAYEFACGFCYKVRPTIKKLVEEYGSKVKVVYKPYIVHADVAVLPALAACAADKQGKFHEMQELIWDKAFAEQDLGEDKINALAKEVGLEMTRYKADLESEGCINTLRESVENLSNLGVNGTPAFYINGRHIAGALPIETFRSLIDEELKKADAAIAGGVTLADYYRKAVIEGGKKSL